MARSRLWPTRWRRIARTSWSLDMPSLKRIAVTEPPLNDIQLEAIHVISGLGRTHSGAWPGIFVVFRRLELRFKLLFRDDFNIIWKILRRDKPTDARECWHWCSAVIQEFQSLDTDESVSMDKVYKHLINHGPAEPTPVERDRVLLAIFAVLCWTSMTLIPALELHQRATTRPDPCPAFRVQGLKPAGQSQTSLTSTARRPIIKVFGILKDLVKDPHSMGGAFQSAAMDTDTIYESSVNFSSLSTIGRVRIKWVEDLTSHLVFDQQSRNQQPRKLSVFCLPTFCVSNILRRREVKILYQITSELFPSPYYPGDSDQDRTLLYRETLLTYRLLFGQSTPSRILATKLLEQLGTSAGDLDTFLSTVCTAPTRRLRYLRHIPNPALPATLFATTILDINRQLIESETYSSQGDFPHFGSRLLAVQQYNLRQQPSRIRDLWHDRRHPLQWYTFWAVLWVGGITIIWLSSSLSLALYRLITQCSQVGTEFTPLG